MSDASSSNSLFMGMLFGGAVISAVGASSTYVMEKQKPKLKTLLRDFIIGAVLVMMLLQVMPETTSSVFQGVSNAVSAIPDLTSVGSSAISDIEIQTGIPKF
ncbi:MAG: hypothetical protein EBU82_12370 [Flavobacteriia bacterium]|nr:hypothetical protein [Flavobacteriia bacterium]